MLPFTLNSRLQTEPKVWHVIAQITNANLHQECHESTLLGWHQHARPNGHLPLRLRPQVREDLSRSCR